MSKEIELCYYCEILNPEGLEQAQATELHEQAEYRVPVDQGQRAGKIRVRKTTKNGEDLYEETIKEPIGENTTLGDTERSVSITQAYFDSWKRVFNPNVHLKQRYIFIPNSVKVFVHGEELVLPPIKFEVDVLIDQQGNHSKWAKVDIELQDVIELIKSKTSDIDKLQITIDWSCLPLNIGKTVSAITNDPEERTAIKNYWEKYSHKVVQNATTQD